MKNNTQRYTVHRARIRPRTSKEQSTFVYLILDGPLPAVTINKHLLLQQLPGNIGRARLHTSKIYYLCKFLNHLDSIGCDIENAGLEDIESYLTSLYIGDDPVGYEVLNDYIDAIANFYEYWILSGLHYNLTLLKPTDNMWLVSESSPPKTKMKKANARITKIMLLKKLYKPSPSDSRQSSYTKWYSPDEIQAIADALDLTHRCIFLITVYTGFRVDSVLSITVDTVDYAANTIRPTRSKTNKMHTAVIPDTLATDLMTYAIEVRSKIDTACNAFFVTRNGNPVSYHSYRRALESARVKVNELYNWHIESLHTHAGRSTFAAALRSYQLEQRRKAIPTFSDTDFCNIMDWKSLDSLEHYDLVTRVQDVSPLLLDFYNNFDSLTDVNSGCTTAT